MEFQMCPAKLYLVGNIANNFSASCGVCYCRIACILYTGGVTYAAAESGARNHRKAQLAHHRHAASMKVKLTEECTEGDTKSVITFF